MRAHAHTHTHTHTHAHTKTHTHSRGEGTDIADDRAEGEQQRDVGGEVEGVQAGLKHREIVGVLVSVAQLGNEDDDEGETPEHGSEDQEEVHTLLLALLQHRCSGVFVEVV